MTHANNSRWPTSTSGSVAFLVTLATVLVLPLAFINHIAQAKVMTASAEAERSVPQISTAEHIPTPTSIPAGADEGEVGAKESEPQDVKTLVLSYFPKDQRPAVEELVFRESSWNPHAINAWSGATGLFQALPWSKTGCNSTEDIKCQAAWGEAYIRDRYGDAWTALNFWYANGWY